MIAVYLMVIALVFVLSYFIAKWFYEVAEEKGYHDRKYFWICFWLGAIGYLLVVAMPDRGNGQQSTINDLPDL